MPPHPLNILVLEDEAVIAMELRRTLVQSGHHVIGPFANIDAGERALSVTAVDVALLDIRLGERKVFPLASRLSRLGIPFAFLSGYEADILPAEMNGRPFMTKPFQPAELVRRVEALASVESRPTEGGG